MIARALPCALLACALASCAGGSRYGRVRDAHGRAAASDAEVQGYRDRPAVVVLEGEATYYSDSLAGNETSNGEVYDPDRFTAASRDLPFGSIVRVIRRDTGARVMVRVNDRGPFGNKKRILDLSRAAAEALHMIGRGVAPVRAEVVHLGEQRRKRGRRR